MELLTATIAKQQSHIEDLIGRVIRLETALELAMAQTQETPLRPELLTALPLHSISLRAEVLFP